MQFMRDTKVEARQERERVGMLVPPPVLLVALVVLCMLAQFAFFGLKLPSMERAVAGGLAIAISALVIVLSARRFVAASTPVRPTSPTTQIIHSGVYAYSRNPMYLAMTGIILGLAILTNSFVFVLAAIIFVIVTHFAVVLPEERYLETLHRADYIAYKKKVRRWV
jgi:protein-S-isoprenylcysteine O-methyltransferase Ste14